ncbi:MAG TPA: UDP-glucose/GDP-mannose dehydrogenase family protein [Streptosporangiaceae bacterium]|nr:UDP-glucose/GDP-mannose dehydrogenase family protein [Streptosporangiaceae bacterium]
MRMTVIGTGYLGAVHAACMAKVGHEVLGVDADPDRVALLEQGRAPFFEPGLEELLGRAVGAGKLRFATGLQQAADFADLHFICVGTPQCGGSNSADLTGVHAVVDDLVPRLTRDSLLVGKSTVPVGTASQLAVRAANLAADGIDVGIAWNPEFLREGTAIRDTLQPERIVVGTSSARADQVLRAAYGFMLEQGTPYISTDVNTAELVKGSANAFLATKLSFINAMADMCEAAGGDILTLSEALGHDSRIGRAYLSAGLGFGGSCLAKDIRAFVARASELGVEDSLSFLREVDEYNLRRRAKTVDIARELVGGSFERSNVAVLGAAFKPDTDDVRDSPALHVAAAVRGQGAQVRVHDPKANDNAREVMPHLDYAPDARQACEDADVVMHLTEWRQYRDLDPAELGSVVRQRRLVDARNTLPSSRWLAAGWTVRGLGRLAG